MDQFKIVILAEAAIILIQLMVIVSMRRRILELSKLHAHFSQFSNDGQLVQKDVHFVHVADDGGSAGPIGLSSHPGPVGVAGPSCCPGGHTGPTGPAGYVPYSSPKFLGPTLPGGMDSPDAIKFDFLKVNDKFEAGDQYGVGFCYTIGDPATSFKPGELVPASMMSYLPRRLKKGYVAGGTTWTRYPSHAAACGGFSFKGGCMVASVKNMKDLSEAEGVLAFCTKCKAENSACAGDYWSCSPDTVLKCCGQPMILVRKHIAYEEIGPNEHSHGPAAGQGAARQDRRAGG